MVWRIIADIVLFLAIFWSPWWWLTLFLVVFFILLFPKFWEAIFAGVLIDALYGSVGVGLFGFMQTWMFTLIFLVALVAVEKTKKQLFI